MISAKQASPFSALAAVALTISFAAAPASAQGVKRIVGMPRTDATALAMGFRASKLIGMPVVNDAGDPVGRIEDVIISRDGVASRAVMSVGGGFIGVGARRVLVDYQDLRLTDTKATLPGATEASIQALPDFKAAQ